MLSTPDISFLTGDGDAPPVFGPRVAKEGHSGVSVSALAAEHKVARDHGAGATLSGFAVDHSNVVGALGQPVLEKEDEDRGMTPTS